MRHPRIVKALAAARANGHSPQDEYPIDNIWRVWVFECATCGKKTAVDTRAREPGSPIWGAANYKCGGLRNDEIHA